MKVTFLPQGKTVEIEAGKTILEAAAKAGVDIDGNCGGKGTCGKCKVKIASEGYVLACLTHIKEDTVVEIPETETTASRKKKLVKLPDSFKADKGESGSVGVAVDIGTTTLVVMFWDLETGRMLDIDAMTNPQGVYGADVISRISFTMENDDGCQILHDKVVNAINSTVEEFCSKKGCDINRIKKYAVVGNTTMSHLFLNVAPASLAVAPFAPAFTGKVVMTGEEAALAGDPSARVVVAPNIAGHVGSDITAGIITTDLMDMDKGHLFIDIGTNGEIVLSAKGRILACSTAAGPAFEGNSVKYGMRAAAGAIERVDLEEEGVKIGSIGDSDPIGICGSGIIDAVGELIRTGVADKSGRILKKDRARSKGISEHILDNIAESEGGNDFLLYAGEKPEENVYITQKDVREIQLAKAAISAGISIMMEEIGIGIDEIEKVSIAGAFGNYIRRESALNMGLLPGVDIEKIQAIGNSAGIGASMILLSEAAEAEAERVSKTVEHIELAEKKNFQDEYLKGMRF